MVGGRINDVCVWTWTKQTWLTAISAVSVQEQTLNILYNRMYKKKSLDHIVVYFICLIDYICMLHDFKIKSNFVTDNEVSY